MYHSEESFTSERASWNRLVVEGCALCLAGLERPCTLNV
jgi:hypothetical protein